ncbi:DUF6688 domain-containing protein [Metabacillus niabensis]|uniref:G protein-coupled receptor n=1 Tax=Metabacillus niabensis TaxID=324854 RepID=A0ABT9YV35_9BACI|nr:DUF6688 family protein [Metabacillus niabensis]MDQ0223853.1 hypothetical protein [Metabacillus niabensis]
MVLWLLLLLFIFIPIYSFIRMLQSFKSTKQGKGRITIIDCFSSLIILCLLTFGFSFNGQAVEAGEPLLIFEVTGQKANGYASLANEYIDSVIALFIVGFICFCLIAFFHVALSPILYVLCSTIIIINIMFAGAYLTHTGFLHDGDYFVVTLLQICFLSLCFLYIAALKESLNHFLTSLSKKGINERNRFLLALYKVSGQYQQMSKLWMITFFPILVIIQFILVLFGQRPDSLIRVFLETSSFNYSMIPAPKPEMVSGDGHYLCTVSAKGHKKLVRPIRAGIRRGERIPVNRQLLIANAFENILEQYVPTIHKIIRNFYDKYGYPISKHIHSKWSADVIYLLMKPLEWFFLIVLYTVDKNPENRIHVQYSELRK